MLSAVIATRHSYPAMPLAGQLVDQRSVHPGPLVDTSPVSRSSDYIFILPHLCEVRTAASYPCELSSSSYCELGLDSSTHESAYLSTQVVTGSISVLKNGGIVNFHGTHNPLIKVASNPVCSLPALISSFAPLNTSVSPVVAQRAVDQNHFSAH